MLKILPHARSIPHEGEQSAADTQRESRKNTHIAVCRKGEKAYLLDGGFAVDRVWA